MQAITNTCHTDGCEGTDGWEGAPPRKLNLLASVRDSHRDSVLETRSMRAFSLEARGEGGDGGEGGGGGGGRGGNFKGR